MKTRESQARCFFKLKGISFQYGGEDEQLALISYESLRDKEYLSNIIQFAKGDKIAEFIDDWRDTVYPEFRITNLSKLEIASRKFERYRDTDFVIKEIV